MPIRDFAYWFEPMINKPEPVSADGSTDTTAPVMPADNDVLHGELIDRELHYRQHVEICRVNKICYISMHKDLPGFQASNYVGRNAAVGTPDPKVFGLLESRQPLEVVFVFGSSLPRPGLISVQ